MNTIDKVIFNWINDNAAEAIMLVLPSHSSKNWNGEFRYSHYDAGFRVHGSLPEVQYFSKLDILNSLTPIEKKQIIKRYI